MYSLGRLATTDLTSIQPTTTVASMLAAVEVVSSVLILVIGAFSILTATRDAYREDFEDFVRALHETAEAIDQRIGDRYSLTAAELELKVAVHSAEVVNFLRRIRGLPEISLPEAGSASLDHPVLKD